MRRVLHTRPPGMLIEQCNLQGLLTLRLVEITCITHYNTAIYFCLHSQQSRQAMLRQRWLAPTGCQGQPKRAQRTSNTTPFNHLLLILVTGSHAFTLLGSAKLPRRLVLYQIWQRFVFHDQPPFRFPWPTTIVIHRHPHGDAGSGRQGQRS